jgi:DNA-binding transcriptional ArsR family regulator
VIVSVASSPASMVAVRKPLTVVTGRPRQPLAPVGLSQPTVSHHLKILVDAGLLSRTKRGVWSYYAVVPGSLENLAGTLAGGVDLVERP